jgi:hypothetical protein
MAVVRLGAIMAMAGWWLVAVAMGCDAGSGTAPHVTGAGGNGASGSGSGSAAGGAKSGAGAGGGISLTGSGVGGGANPDGGRPEKCDDAGHCTCINIASIGMPGTYGAGNDNTNQFQTWLDTKSSANLDLITTHQTLTPALLANYDVIILQELADGVNGPFWTFTQAEVDALTAWVKAGGGLISLTGYTGSTDEVTPENQLLALAGISYNMDDILGNCPSGDNCYCWGSSVPLGGWQASSPISANIKQVGAFHGRSINAGSAATVVCTDGTTKYAVSQQVAKGRVFVFCDEWVTYTSQWDGTGAPVTNPSDPCYMMDANQVFQVAQFWYNVIKWVAPNSACFDINDPTIVQ